MTGVENRPVGYTEQSITASWPATLEGFMTVIFDSKNQFFEAMAKVIEGPDCRKALASYIVKGSNDGEFFCPISRKPSEARAWVKKMRKKRNGHS